ncbi:SPOR domain-containing protein [Actibacterium sp. D379-3]
MVRNGIGRGAFALCAALALAACEEGSEFKLFAPKDSAAAASGDATTTRLVERDVEAPDVFQASEDGLWDGRPSLGGVWVAYPDVEDPERVIIRNETNGKFVIGALFNRERDNPGPKLQVSSDAASALGLLAGQPTRLNVTALRKQEVPVVPPVSDETVGAQAEDKIETETLAPLAAAAAAIDKAEGKTAAAPTGATTPAATPPAPAAKPQASSLDKPFIQIGIFSIEANANRTATALRGGGIVPTVLKQESSGKTFWRVVVGPAGSSSERATLLKKVKGLGYSDAYYVTN